MTTLSLSLLGPIAGTVNGRSLEMSSSRAQALLAYVAMNQEYPQRREALMELLWPGMPPQSAQVNLRRALYLLRQALTAEDQSASDGLLLADRHTIQLNPDADVDLDVQRFCSLLRGSPSQEQLEDAIALYRSDFLSDFYLADSAPFEEWAAAQRADLRRQALEAYDRLVSLLLGQAEFESAQTYVQQQLAPGPAARAGPPPPDGNPGAVGAAQPGPGAVRAAVPTAARRARRRTLAQDPGPGRRRFARQSWAPPCSPATAFAATP